MQKRNIEWIIKLDDNLDLDLEQTMQKMSQSSADPDQGCHQVGAGGASALPIFDRSVNPRTQKRTDRRSYYAM